MSGGRTRVLKDERGERTRYEDIEVGYDLGSLEWEITQAMIDAQCHLDDDYHAWYKIDSPFGGVIAQPQLTYRPPRWLISRNFNIRGLFYKWQMENLAPLKPGERITVSGRIVDKYVKNEREYVTYEAIGTSESGAVLFKTRRTHVLDYVERTAARAGVGVDSGIKAEKL
ncbi:MAG: MaoC family dehydratase [Patescibacteria group bacterium]